MLTVDTAIVTETEKLNDIFIQMEMMESYGPFILSAAPWFLTPLWDAFGHSQNYTKSITSQFAKQVYFGLFVQAHS